MTIKPSTIPAHRASSRTAFCVLKSSQNARESTTPTTTMPVSQALRFRHTKCSHDWLHRNMVSPPSMTMAPPVTGRPGAATYSSCSQKKKLSTMVVTPNTNRSFQWRNACARSRERHLPCCQHTASGSPLARARLCMQRAKFVSKQGEGG